MLSDQFIAELRAVIQTQNHLLRKLETTVSDLEVKFADVSSQTEQIRELEKMMAEIETSVDFLEEDDLSDFQPDRVLQLYNNRHLAVSHDLVKIGYKDWDSFVRKCQIYALQQQLDPLAPYEALLTDADLKRLHDESYNAQFVWDKSDYIFVGASGILAAITDFLLVRIPATINTGEYSGQIGSPITEWLKQYNTNKGNDWFAKWAQHLSETCKVPYDNQNIIEGMYPRSHRLQSLGHDPILGFIFGVLDIMRGTITGFSYDKLTGNHTWICEFVSSKYQPLGLIEAILRHIGHLISDVATPMGLPAPFMTLIQGINIGSFGENNRTVGEVARWMYLNGYDFRHFLVSGITPAVIEIMLRAYIMLRHYSEHGETKFNLASHPKYRSMLLASHSIAALGNVGKIALMQGNPLAINYAEWMALFRYLIPSMKYWLFDEQRLRLEHLEKINETGWNELLENSEKIVQVVAQKDYSVMTLGELS
jgi:hypothetical protein